MLQGTRKEGTYGKVSGYAVKPNDFEFFDKRMKSLYGNVVQDIGSHKPSYTFGKSTNVNSKTQKMIQAGMLVLSIEQISKTARMAWV